MPGVLIVEAIAQAGGALLLTEVEDRKDKLIMFTGIERAKFRRPVVPGDQLRIEVELKNWRARASMVAVRMEGMVYVGARRVAEAVVSCQLVDTARGRGGSMAPQRRTNRNKFPYGQTPAAKQCSAADSPAKTSAHIHPTAIIDPRAKIHPSCKIGPYCVIGPEVEMGEGCHLVSHVAIEGPTKIGSDNGFFPFCFDRHGAAGHHLRRRTHASRDRRPQRDSRVCHHQPRDRQGRRADRAWAATRWSWPTRTSRTIASLAIT